MERRRIYGVTFEQGRNDLKIDASQLQNIVSENKDLPESAKIDLLTALITLKYTQSNSVCFANAAEVMFISRRRLCAQASPETRAAWRLVVDALAEKEQELAACCVPECVYRGFCPEFRSCGFVDTPAFAKCCLRAHGVPFTRHAARQITPDDYAHFDWILCMEDYNIRNLRRVLGEELMTRDSTLPWNEGHQSKQLP